jgi:hypothetical protein
MPNANIKFKMFKQGSDRITRRQTGKAPSQATLPSRHWSLRLPNHRNQRRDCSRCTNHLPPRWQLVRRFWSRAQLWHQALQYQWSRQQPVHCRGGNVHPTQGAHRTPRWWCCRWLGQLVGHHPRWKFRASPTKEVTIDRLMISPNFDY